MKRNFFIFLMLTTLLSVSAKSNGEPKEILQGKWVFESAVAFEDNTQIPFSEDNLDFEVPTEINVQQDMLTFAYKGGTKIEKFGMVVRVNFFCFLVCAEWKVEGNKLLLQWEQDIDNPENMSEARMITLIYKLK